MGPVGLSACLAIGLLFLPDSATERKVEMIAGIWIFVGVALGFLNMVRRGHRLARLLRCGAPSGCTLTCPPPAVGLSLIHI